MHDEVKANDLIFINEMGLDPGIDHMSAMEMLDDLRSEGGKIKRVSIFYWRSCSSRVRYESLAL